MRRKIQVISGSWRTMYESTLIIRPWTKPACSLLEVCVTVKTNSFYQHLCITLSLVLLLLEARVMEAWQHTFLFWILIFLGLTNSKLHLTFTWHLHHFQGLGTLHGLGGWYEQSASAAGKVHMIMVGCGRRGGCSYSGWVTSRVIHRSGSSLWWLEGLGPGVDGMALCLVVANFLRAGTILFRFQPL